MTRIQHAARIGVLMALAAILLGWLAAHAEILFADGLRYIDQARKLDQGALVQGILKSVDHPAYPLAIVAAHHVLGGESPEAWQGAAQAAAVVAGILLVVPLYLVSAELFGPTRAWLACLLIYAVPLTGHVLADALSESTFLLFWTWGLWAAIRFLKEGTFGWLPPAIGFGALAYLSRPEGLLLPAALVATLALTPLLRSNRLNWPRWWAAVAFLVIGPALLVGPYVALKGGLGTKPAVARLLGTAPKSPADAVERKEPLPPGQSTLKTYALGFRAMGEAVKEAVTIPLLPLVLAGFVASWPPGPRARIWLFLMIVGVAAALALVRLYATGGYCSPRHAMVLALLLIPAAAAGLHRILHVVAIPGRWIGLDEGRYTAGPAVWVLVLGGLGVYYAPAVLTPINHGFGGYRGAAAHIAKEDPSRAPVVDVTGWTLFYGQRTGYTFANLAAAFDDPKVRWIVVRDAHLRGPWTYCHLLRAMVAGMKPVKAFPEDPRPHEAQVYVFDRQAGPDRTAMEPAVIRRRR